MTPKPSKRLYQLDLLGWCPGQGSNLHYRSNQILSLARLPIPPPGPKNGGGALEIPVCRKGNPEDAGFRAGFQSALARSCITAARNRPASPPVTER
jgi:hypothetical protein